MCSDRAVDIWERERALARTTVAWGVVSVLAGLQRPLEALFAHLTASAHLLGLLDLEDGRSGVADGEEQLRVLVEAG